MKFLTSLTAIWLILASGLQAAALEFKELIKEIHAPADVTDVTTDFEFTNKSGKPVNIAKSDPGCSCLKVQISGGKLLYAPGESGVIRATFDMGNFSGTVDKLIALWLNDDAPDKPSMTLTVRVHIPVLVGVDPKTVKWEIGASADPQTIKVHMAGDKPIAVKNVKSSSESFTTELKTVVLGKEYEVIVTPKNMNAPGMAVIRIETDCEIAKHRTQQVFGVVRKPTPAETATKP